MTFDKSLPLSEPQFLHVESRVIININNSSTVVDATVVSLPIAILSFPSLTFNRSDGNLE